MLLCSSEEIVFHGLFYFIYMLLDTIDLFKNKNKKQLFTAVSFLLFFFSLGGCTKPATSKTFKNS